MEGIKAEKDIKSIVHVMKSQTEYKIEMKSDYVDQ